MEDETAFGDLLLDLTEDDFALIDMITSQHELKSMATETEAEQRKPAKDDHTPIQRYRRSGMLSVTDITAPVWCEVQYDYGLRQRRHLRVEDRPATFQSASGKEIHADHSLAVVNEAKMKEGERIHRDLERAIHPEEVTVELRSPEERWALRVIEMMLGIHSIIERGICREFPVFGIIENQCLVGVIDEVRMVFPTSAQSSSQPSAKNGQDRQLQLHQFFPQGPLSSSRSLEGRTPGIRGDNARKTRVVLQILDHKTRRVYSLPGHPDTLSARLQLMAYKALLEALLTPGEGTLNSVWVAAGLDPLKQFTASFQRATSDMMQDGHSLMQRANNLQLLGAAWKQFVNATDFVVEDELKIVYLHSDSASNTEEAEDVDLQYAIEASLGRPEGSPSLGRSVPKEGTERSLADPITKEGFSIIGTKVFKFDQKVLAIHMRHVMQYWLGARSPAGVKLKDVGRCRSCEYENDCEWLQKKANDIANRRVRE